MTTVLWSSAALGSMESCTLGTTPDGHTLTGTVLLPIDGQPGEIRYVVLVDDRWRTRVAGITVMTAAGRRHLSLGSDGDGGWHIDGVPAPDIHGCTDIDLGFSPSTNTLPIRRLSVAEGEVVPVRAAWVRFPEFTTEVLEQSYERIEANRWCYRSGTGFAAELTVDASGLVLNYGDVWTAIAHSE